jgi:hypothetical protein
MYYSSNLKDVTPTCILQTEQRLKRSNINRKAYEKNYAHNIKLC